MRATQNTALFDLRQLYAEGATSREATGDVATGYAGLEAKMKQWESMQMGTTWRPRNVFVKGDTIAGLVIVIVNLLGGLGIGVVKKGLEPAVALKKYGLLSIGDIAAWWRRATELTSARILHIRPSHITTLAGLPVLHKDPFDRILVAQAKAEGLALVTNDGPIGEYPVQTRW